MVFTYCFELLICADPTNVLKSSINRWRLTCLERWSILCYPEHISYYCLFILYFSFRFINVPISFTACRVESASFPARPKTHPNIQTKTMFNFFSSLSFRSLNREREKTVSRLMYQSVVLIREFISFSML